jgi:pantoate--beta-alanine ligase
MSRDDRRIAPGIYKSLCCGRDLMESGERSSSMIVHAVKAELKEAGISEIEYAELVRVSDLKPIDPIRGRVLLAVAVRVGRTRLIDNMVFDVGEKVRESKLF